MLRMKKSSFEGWYFKHQIGDRVFSFIVSFHSDEHEEECAYIQFITNEGTCLEKFKIEDCYVNPETFHIKIGPNRFGRDGCRVHMKAVGMNVACNIRYGEFTKVPTDIMGPFGKVKGLQCRHHIYSMTHSIEGFVDINEEAIELSGGTGYIEGDSGVSFPKSYMWTHCNFKHKGQHSIMLACADVPMLVKGFEGVVCQILYRGKQYRLATYKGAKIIQKTKMSIGIKQGDMRVYIMALEDEGHLLHKPEKGVLKLGVRENPAGRIRYVFYKDDKKIFDFISRCGSFESYTQESKR